MNYIIYPGVLDIRKGGPSGYIANLEKALTLIEGQKKVNIISIDKNMLNNNINDKKYKQLVKHLLKHFDSLISKRYEKILIDNNNFISIKNEIEKIKSSSNDVIHVHTVFDYQNLLREQISGKIVLTPHTPESISEEVPNLIRSNYNNNNLKLTNLVKRLKDLEETAFRQCENFIFPSEESMEIYANLIEDFHDIIKDKNVYYNFTGCERLNYRLDRAEFRRKYNIPQDTFLISYIGRHNKIKGFDILTKVAKEIEKIDKNILFISGGTGSIKSDSSNFIEVGWTNDPGSIINASDLFILPNRNTYFDLVLLEVLSIGTPVLASNTGGNKSVGKITDGVKLFQNENTKEIIDNILFLKDKKEVLENMRVKNIKCYNDNFTLEKFGERYLKILEEINASN